MPRGKGESEPRRIRDKQIPPALKRLGQNFLSDRSILGRIADSLELSGDETVVEIGAGRGSLTEQLAARCKRLIAIEIDRALIPFLREKFSSRPHVEIVEGDALEMSFGALAGNAFRLTGNVPYYITTPLMFHALEHPRAEVSSFLVQKEVAERAVAGPGSKTYGALSVNLQAIASVELLFTVPPGAFVPRPKVDSAVLRLRPLAVRIIPEESERAFKTFVLATFAQRRKQLQRILRTTHSLSGEAAEKILIACGIEPSARPETLTPQEFAKLNYLLVSANDNPSSSSARST